MSTPSYLIVPRRIPREKKKKNEPPSPTMVLHQNVSKHGFGIVEDYAVLWGTIFGIPGDFTQVLIVPNMFYEFCELPIPVPDSTARSVRIFYPCPGYGHALAEIRGCRPGLLHALHAVPETFCKFCTTFILVPDSSVKICMKFRTVPNIPLLY